MNTSIERKAGFALIDFTILLVFTMVLHPAGGSIAYIIKITNVIIVTHAIAIFSLPFGWVGFYGLTRRIGMDHFGALLAFAMISLGLLAIMMAAATNGLILPLYLQHYNNASPETIESIKPVMRYGFAINEAFDYVYTIAFCIAIGCWSVAIIYTKKLPAWIGWLGLLVCIATICIFFSGIVLNHLSGFRLSVSVIIAWILLVGIELIRAKENKNS
jgi:hypothetical protein